MTEKDLTTFDCCKWIANDYPFCPEGKYYNAAEVHKLLEEKDMYIEQLREKKQAFKTEHQQGEIKCISNSRKKTSTIL